MGRSHGAGKPAGDRGGGRPFAAMVDDLLDATKLQSGDVILKKSQIDIPNLVEAQIRRFSPETAHHQIRMEMSENFPSSLLMRSASNNCSPI